MSSSSSSSPEITPASQGALSQEQFSYKYATHEDVLEDLSSRFILNLPEEELASLERICFQVEQAHWFYEDFVRESNPKFPSLPLKKFSAMLFHACPMLHQWSHSHEQAFTNFMQYKTRVPVCGAIMLNDTWEKCLLVKGWKSSSGWGFPKGKINEDEPPPACAAREVLEETGYNLAGKINPEDVIEMSIREQKIALYIVANVPEDFPFKTKTRKEISKIQWFRLVDLPTWKRNKQPAGKFYLITPFISALKQFIHDRKPRNLPRKPPKSNRSLPAIESSPSVSEPAVADSPYTAYQDAHQESSSQSSSADNGDPQTPSPQCSQSAANHVDVVSAPESESIDPHFARLLSSLTMSGAAAAAKDKQLNTPLPIPIREEPTRERSTPIPISSSTGTPASEVVSTSPISLQPSSLSGKPRPPPRTPLLQSSQPSYRTSSPAFTAASVLPLPQSSAEVNKLASPSLASFTTSPRTSRRSSSIADISPYLSKSTEVPTSAKRLRQLALLESVADESARMSPLLREPNRIPQNLVGYPLPPASVPPQAVGTNDPNVIYSSGSGAFPPSMPAFDNLPPRPHMYEDPFQIRPRTSQAINRPLYHAPPPASMSMNQTQLLALMNNASSTSQPVPHQLYQTPLPRPLQSVPPSLYPPLAVQPFRQPPFSPLPMQAPPPNTTHFPTSFMAAPQPHLSLPPTVTPVYGQPSSLLSILNGQRR